jgi:hypothetical protein
MKDTKKNVGQCDFRPHWVTHPFTAKIELMIVCSRHGEVAQSSVTYRKQDGTNTTGE